MSSNWFDEPYWRWREDRDTRGTECEKDTQRLRVYRAEKFLDVLADPPLASFEACVEFVGHIVQSARFDSHFMTQQILVLQRSHKRSAALGSWRSPQLGAVSLPEWARKRWVILHEMAHAVTPPQTGGGHGRYWCMAYSELIRWEFGKEVSDRLKANFRSLNVRYSLKRPPSVMSPGCVAARPTTIPGRPSKRQFELAALLGTGTFAPDLESEIVLAAETVSKWRSRRI